MARRPTTRKAAAPAPLEDWTTDLAQAIVDGRILSGELVRLAAERHLRDLRDAGRRGLHWRPELARTAVGFFPAVLTVTAGAKAGQPFRLLDWHAFTVGSVYGWRRADGLRRFRTVWMETGKGQAKSPLMAGVGLLEMGFAGVRRAEIYAIAGDKDQANVLFRDAVAMCRAPIPGGGDGETDTLESRGEIVIRGTGDMAWKIEHPASESKFQAIASGDAISGPRPRVVLADEVHELKSAAPIELWSAAIAKIPGDPLMMLGTNTPAVDQVVGTEYSDYYQSVVRGEFPDDASFAFIARTDKGDKPLEDDRCWVKSLPALDITFPRENVQAEVQKAVKLASKRLAVLRLYFGVPVGASSYWIDVDAWDSCLGEVDEADVDGWPCFLGLDLSQRNDLTALAATWVRPDDGHRFVKIWYWKPAESLAEAEAKDKAPYKTWAEAGALTAVPGKTIGKDFVVAKVAEICARHDVQAMAFDPAHILDFIAEADVAGCKVWEWKGPDEPQGIGLKLIRHAQGVRGMHSEKMLWMPRSVGNLEDCILNGSITFDETGITTWCSANATLVADGQGNRYFDKKRSRGRIDGIVSAAMSVGASFGETVSTGAGSIWDNPELRGVL